MTGGFYTHTLTFDLMCIKRLLSMQAAQQTYTLRILYPAQLDRIQPCVSRIVLKDMLETVGGDAMATLAHLER